MDAPTCLVRDFFVNYINSHNKNLDDLPYFIVWGTGHFGSVVMQGCEAIGISPIAVMDSNDKKVDTDFFGFSVSSVDVALKNFPDAIVVIAIADMFAYELKKNLTKRNIKSFAFLEFFQWLASSSLLEIGPFNAPVLRGGGVKYLDVCDESTLKHKAQEAGMPTENIPNKIDFVIPNGNWDIVTERFDCIFSANLVEHQPDIVKHLQDISKHLYRGGVYIVYIPDKRYCFDHYFPVSTLEDVLAAHFEKRNNHCFTDLLRTYMHTHCDCSMHWQGNHGRQQVLSREQYEQLSSRYRMSLASGEYMDAHAWFFVPEAFFQIVEQLREMDFIDLRIECFYPTGYMESGFVACLKKDRK